MEKTTEKVSAAHKELMLAKAGLLKAVAHPVRLCLLLKLVRDGEMNVSQITSCLDVSQSAISQHLGTLRLNGIVQTRKSANHVFYSCAHDEVKQLLDVIFKEA